MTAATIADFRITPAPPGFRTVVDLEARGASGHLGHAMIQLADSTVLAMYPECTVEAPGRYGTHGHSANGYMRVLESRDAGETWDERGPLEYSHRAFAEQRDHRVFTEKLVQVPGGPLVACNLRSDVTEDTLWEPYLPATISRSEDDGRSWDGEEELSGVPGRIYDAIPLGDEILLLELQNDAVYDFAGKTADHRYVLHASGDRGRTFSERSVLPFTVLERGYGTMCVLADGTLIAYVYNKTDETHCDYVTSDDGGSTWSAPRRSFFAHRVRNPQMIAFGDGYFLHGRSGSYGDDLSKGNVVLYYSNDGVIWDEGTFIALRRFGQGGYSNSIEVAEASGERKLLIMSSHAYRDDMTNVIGWEVRADA